MTRGGIDAPCASGTFHGVPWVFHPRPLPVPEAGDSPLSLDLRTRVPEGGALVRDRLAGEGQASRFFPADFRDPEAYRAKAAEIDARLTGSARTDWLDAVSAPGARAQARLEALREGRGYVVTTGQQPALFGGPLYSLYKAVTAAVLAERLEALVGAPVAPLFWTASEDHDWDEADHTYLVGVDNELHRIALPEVDGSGSAPLHRLPIGPSVEACLEQVAQHVPPTDFAPPLLELLREAYSASATLPGAFEQVMAAMLEPLGVLFVQAHAPALKRLSGPVLMHELEHSEAHEEALAERVAELQAAGYKDQVHILEGGVNLFLEGPAGRERVYRDEAGVHLRHSEAAFTLDEVRACYEDDPSVLSPNVLLRPVVESAVFPTLAYIAGPSEQAYFAEMEPLFAAHGIGMPVIMPRLGATVVESKIGKVLDKFDLDISDLHRPFHEIAGDRARDEVPDAVRQALGELQGTVARGVSTLTKAAREIDPTLKGPIQHVRSVAFDAIGDVERKILQAVKRENEISLQQIEKAHLHLFPDTRPQERVFNPFYYLVRYGDDFVADVAESFAAALPSLGREG
ncbi:MAG: bacillithiol biosynthesis cysteine-adding enzyme BshC [Gemmatimonadetes bacterium]|nr:bacillithiol biosynthesis cysteine-adding enzyme BshC [Gemmatimonadota bacterium]